MKKQFDSSTAVAAVRQPDAGSLFSEIGFSATFFDSMPAEIALVSEGGEILAANDRFRREFGDSTGLVWRDFLANESFELIQNLRSAFSRGFHSFEVSYRTSGEKSRDFQIDAFRLHGDSPWAALIHKPTHRPHPEFWFPSKQTDLLQLDAPTPKKSFYGQHENARQAMIAIDEENTINFVNRSAAKLFGAEPQTLKGHDLMLFLFQKSDSFDTVKNAFQTGECLFKKPNGDAIWLDIQELPGQKREKLLILNDISARKAEATELQNALELYRIFINQSDYEVFRFEITETWLRGSAIDLIANAIVANAVLSPFTEVENESSQKQIHLPGTTIGQFFGSQELAVDIVIQFLKSDFTLFKKEIIETSSDGHETFFNTNMVGVLDDGSLRRIWISRRDITIRKQAEKAYVLAEDQLRQSQKIEPIGRLAGGIAHDFNNFLAVIMLQIEMMNQELDESSPLRRRVSEIKTVTDKAANMVKQLLAFGRKQTMQPHHVNLNEVAEEFIKMAGSLIGEDIEIEVALEDELGACFVDPNQITQIFMNLAINSRDAMPDGGKLRISTTNLSIDEDTFKHRAQPKGNYIQLSVEDTGSGMDPATMKHVFEPFFTTKEMHKGTGLGLATVYGIVKQSKGFIWVDSTVDEGSRFRVQFPRTDKPASVIKPERASTIPRGNETILLVEDEELIRRNSVEVLNSLGYTVLEASDGAEAASVAANYQGAIHLLLTDVVMPRMNGRELAKKVKTSHPELSILFMSGYADDIITRHGILEEDVHFLGKPFSPLTLAMSVRKAIGNSVNH